eukprot:SAG11_NODE_2176_length_3717_cov_2.881426_2_plen_115_part_00
MKIADKLCHCIAESLNHDEQCKIAGSYIVRHLQSKVRAWHVSLAPILFPITRPRKWLYRDSEHILLKLRNLDENLRSAPTRGRERSIHNAVLQHRLRRFGQFHQLQDLWNGCGL